MTTFKWAGVVLSLSLVSAAALAGERKTCGGIEIGDEELLKKCIQECSKHKDAQGQVSCAEEFINRAEAEWEPEPREVVEAEGIGATIACTSYLRDKQQPLRYGPEKAFDQSKETAWVEGQPGDGIGQQIAFVVAGDELRAAKQITILPGLGKPKVFKKNNRVKKAKLSIHERGADLPAQYFDLIGLGKKILEKDLEFEDEMKMQAHPLGLEPGKLGAKAYVVILQILDVHRGTRWRDTPIAEIVVE